jgi:hypothetical protein
MTEIPAEAEICEHYWAWVKPAGTSNSARLCMMCHQPDPDWLNTIFEKGDETIDILQLNPENAFEAILIKMVETHRGKALDYAGQDHPNQNFYDSAYQLGLTGGHSVEALIATKQARLRVLLPQHWSQEGASPVNEGIEDTLLDRAVYAVIALTIWNEEGYLMPWIAPD